MSSARVYNSWLSGSYGNLRSHKYESFKCSRSAIYQFIYLQIIAIFYFLDDTGAVWPAIWSHIIVRERIHLDSNHIHHDMILIDIVRCVLGCVHCIGIMLARRNMIPAMNSQTRNTSREYSEPAIFPKLHRNGMSGKSVTRHHLHRKKMRSIKSHMLIIISNVLVKIIQCFRDWDTAARPAKIPARKKRNRDEHEARWQSIIGPGHIALRSHSETFYLLHKFLLTIFYGVVDITRVLRWTPWTIFHWANSLSICRHHNPKKPHSHS